MRIIVFVDDLDRCSPLKTLEVLESIKVFLDIECFIFVIGIDHLELPSIIETDFGEDKESYLEKISKFQFIYLIEMTYMLKDL